PEHLLQILPFDSTGGNLSETLAIAFTMEGDIAEPTSIDARLPISLALRLGIPGAVFVTGLELGTPAMYLDPERDGQDGVRVVLAGKGGQHIGFALRWVADHPDEHPEAATDLMRGQGALLEPLGTGHGHQTSIYIDSSFLIAPAGHAGVEIWSDDVEVTRGPVDTRPIAVAGDVTVSTRFDTDRGWGVGFGGLFTDTGTASFDVSVSHHGHGLSERGTSLDVAKQGLLDAPPLYAIIGGGNGSASVDMDFTMVQTPTQFVDLGLVHFHIGATLPDLIGADAEAVMGLDNVPFLRLEDRITVLHGDSMSLQLPEPADVCTQGIVGNIGSSDGVVPIMNDAR
ncbi:MAG: hypothetical protein R3246_17450, partial [Acidimicrobiia bacterium]|nr:hypothetical protein [Acidimicrobiia bacterium]